MGKERIESWVESFEDKFAAHLKKLGKEEGSLVKKELKFLENLRETIKRFDAEGNDGFEAWDARALAKALLNDLDAELLPETKEWLDDPSAEGPPKWPDPHDNNNPLAIYKWDDYLKPETTEDLQKLVQQAREQKSKLRVIGSGHAPKMSREGTGDDEASIRCILVGDFRKMEYVELPVGENGAMEKCVKAGGGMHLGEDPSDPTSYWSNSLCKQLADDGYALAVIGGIAHQTVAGFLGTGGSGGSTRYGYWDGLVEIQVMDGQGRIRTFKNPSFPKFFDPKNDEKGFEAVGVSMGLMGIIVSATFRLTANYFCKGFEVCRLYDDSVLGPTSNGSGQYRWTEEATEWDYLHTNTFVCEPYLHNVMEWHGQRSKPVPPDQILPYNNILHTKLMLSLAIIALEVGDLIPSCWVRGFLLHFFSKPDKKAPFNDVWWRTLPSDQQAPEDTYFMVDFTELWLPFDKTDEVIEALNVAWEEKPLLSGNFATETYSASASPFWMGPSYDRKVIRIDPYWYHWNLPLWQDTYDFFKGYWDVLLPIEGCRLHWGKWVPQPGEKCGTITYDQEFLRARYDKYDDWIKFRAEMDPENIFLTNYWKEHLFIPETVEVKSSAKNKKSTKSSKETKNKSRSKKKGFGSRLRRLFGGKKSKDA